ncbi:RWD domain containing protein [Aphelenchoides avenae]|nr:RWD domain containing protein [Aphelenchus avenae]
MDAKEQQMQELEALEMIYPSEVNILCRDYPTISLEVTLPSTTYGRNGEEEVTNVSLHADLPRDYPDVVPEIDLVAIEENVDPMAVDRVLKELRQLAEENVGMPMIFTLVSSLQETLGRVLDELQVSKMESEDLERRKKEQAEREHFERTRVTVESFNEWRATFEREMKEKEDAELKAKQAALAGRLTGKQMFLRDASLNVSDAAIMQNAGDDIEIDETLFEDDIDLPEDDDD